jgi:hypothetical protein
MKFCISLLIIESFLASLAAQDLSNARTDSQPTRQHHEEAVLEYLRDVAWSSRKAMRLYYQADCHSPKAASIDDDVPFPTFSVQPPSGDKSGLAAVREIFKNAKDVTIKEEPEGIIRIWIGKVPTEILQTRIPQVRLDRLAQYDPELAIGAIENTKEIDAAKHSLRVTSVLNVGGLMAPAEKSLPSLPSSMTNLTMDQALDMIAKTWGGPVVYGACSVPTGQKGTKMFRVGYGGAVLGTPF